MRNLLDKFSQWLSEEQEILDQLAHDVAMSGDVEDMLKAKSAYNAQESKLNTIQEAIRFIETECEVEDENEDKK